MSGRSGSWPTVAGWLRPFADSVVTLLFPANCRICTEPLLQASRLPVCQPCRDSILPISGNLCPVCGERVFSFYSAVPSPGVAEPEPCGLCHRAPPPYAQAVAYGAFEDSLRATIHLLKYDRVLPAADFLGQILNVAIAKLSLVGAEAIPDDGWLVVPVPLHSSKLGQRGFNQAELIARAALRSADWRNLRLEAKALVRSRETVSQAGLTRHQRRQNIRGAFRVRKPGLVRGRNILLVDDVFTTGATVSECARVLLRAGAQSVQVVTVARALKADRAFTPVMMTEAAA
jgi:ComF family protein